jgi:hypothetical protein
VVVEELLQSFISVVDTQLLKCIELKGNEIENDSEFLNEKYVLHVNKRYRKQKGQSRDICNIGHTRRRQKKNNVKHKQKTTTMSNAHPIKHRG